MKPLRGKHRTVLYLDYDGALHHEDVWWSPRRGPFIKAVGHSYKLFEHASLLSTVLAPYPDVDIVLSTSWVRHYGFSKAARRLTLELRRRVIGATFHSEMNTENFVAKPRGQQIAEDAARRMPRAWLAIDDDDELWPEQWRANLVKTDPELGISAPAVLRDLREKLEKIQKL